MGVTGLHDKNNQIQLCNHKKVGMADAIPTFLSME